MRLRSSVLEWAAIEALPACVHVFLGVLLGRSYKYITVRGCAHTSLSPHPHPPFGDAVQTFYSHWQAQDH